VYKVDYIWLFNYCVLMRGVKDLVLVVLRFLQGRIWGFLSSGIWSCANG